MAPFCTSLSGGLFRILTIYMFLAWTQARQDNLRISSLSTVRVFPEALCRVLI